MTNLSVEMDPRNKSTIKLDGIEIPNVTCLTVTFHPGHRAEATFTVLADEALVRADEVDVSATAYEPRGGVPYPRIGDPMSGGTVW